jgi:hypothetical protein
LHRMQELLALLVDLDKLVKKAGFIESTL